MAQEANDATAAVEVPEGIDADGVEAWFRANAAVEPPLSYRRISGGRSNLTFEVSDQAGRRWALRRPPLGKRLGSAHDMGRELREIDFYVALGYWKLAVILEGVFARFSAGQYGKDQPDERSGEATRTIDRL